MKGDPGGVMYGSPDSSGVRIGSAEFFIGKLLDKLAAKSDTAFNIMQEHEAVETEFEAEIKAAEEGREDPAAKR